ncbi:hypothetical protein V8E54_007782 [Elaphomyces granulatus]
MPDDNCREPGLPPGAEAGSSAARCVAVLEYQQDLQAQAGRAWAKNTRGFDDGDLVTADKLVAFLSTEVIDRQSRGWKRKQAAEESDDKASKTIGKSSVMSYVTTLTTLCAPRREKERRYEEYHDRGDTLADGYSLTQLASAVRHLWQSPDPELGLRTLTDLLLANAMLLRAGNRVDIELPDLIFLRLEGEGIASPCWPSCGRERPTRPRRSTRWPPFCTGPHLPGAVPGSPPPKELVPHPAPGEDDVDRARSRRGKKIAYSTLYDQMAKCFQAGIQGLSVTHLPDPLGPRAWSRRGSRKTRSADWTLKRCYLSSICWEACRAQAGFEKEVGSLYIPRDNEEPPPELLKLIWPELDGFLKVRDAEQLDPVKPIPEHRLCLASVGLANLLQQFRWYLLQDSAILRPMFPTRSGPTTSSTTRFDPRAAAPAAVPAVAAQLQTIRQEHSHQLQQNQQILNQLRGHRLVPLPGRGSEGSSWAELADDGGRIAIAGGGGPAAAATPTPHPTMADDSDRHGPLHLASSGELDPIPDPTYRMSRQATTVAQLYTEWFTGLGDKPSAVQMDRQFGPKWRSENKEKVFYSVTLRIGAAVVKASTPSSRHLQGAMVAHSKGLQALSIAIRNWRHPGARKKKDEDWYDGPGMHRHWVDAFLISFSFSFFSSACNPHVPSLIMF